jgi:SagB-type dehydrogenase family enzyme
MRQKGTPQTGTGEAVPKSIRLLAETGARLKLPQRRLEAGVALETTLAQRRSYRDYSDQPLELDQLCQLLWAAMGVTAPGGLRTAPSAGATYPVKPYLLSGNVDGLAAGFYRFDPDECTLELLSKGDKRKRFAGVVGDQQCAADAPVCLLLTGWFGRLRREFGPGNERLADIEAGHIGQNWCLAAQSLGLGAIGLAKFDAVALKLLLRLPDDEEPLYAMLAGHR